MGETIFRSLLTSRYATCPDHVISAIEEDVTYIVSLCFICLFVGLVVCTIACLVHFFLLGHSQRWQHLFLEGHVKFSLLNRLYRTPKDQLPNELQKLIEAEKTEWKNGKMSLLQFLFPCIYFAVPTTIKKE